MSSRRNKLLPSKIPPITTLRQQLDYGDANLSRCITFYDDVRAFRKKYNTSTGLPGASLHDWKSPEHQAGLDEMTNAYLDSERNGVHYWPDDDASPRRNKLRYSQDHKRIKEIMRQLFFRLNQQQYRNIKYKKKDRQSLEPSDGPGSSPAIPIEIDESEQGEDRTDDGESSLSPRLERLEQTVKQTDDSLAMLLEKFRASTRQNYSSLHDGENDATRHGDIYEIPVTLQCPTTSGGVTSSQNVRSTPPTSRIPPVQTEMQNPIPSEAYTRWRGKHNLDAESVPAQERPRKVVKLAYKNPSNPRQRARPATHTSPPVAKRASPSESKVTCPPKRATESGPNETVGSRHITAGVEEEVSLGETSKSWTTPEHSVATAGHVQTGIVAKTSVPRSKENVAISSANDISTRTQGASPLDNNKNVEAAHAPVTHSSSLPTTSSSTSNPPGSHQPTEQNPPAVEPKQTVKSKSLIEFVYRVIVSRTPVYVSKRWHPKGKFQDKTLHDLLTELPIEGGAVKTLNVMLEGPGMSIEDNIDVQDEAGFESMKRHFNKRIRAFLASSNAQSAPSVFEMEIEPVREGDGGGENGSTGEGEDFTW